MAANDETHSRLRVIQTSDNGGVEDGNPLSDGLSWVVQKGRQIGIGSESEAGNTLLCAIHDEISSVREGDHARHNALRRLKYRKK